MHDCIYTDPDEIYYYEIYNERMLYRQPSYIPRYINLKTIIVKSGENFEELLKKHA